MATCVWLKPPGGYPWTPVGEAGSPRVLPGSVNLQADENGPSQATFVCNVDARQPVPMFQPNTKVRVEIDGAQVWSGTVQTAPRTGRSITVTCQGRQSDLDKPLVDFTPIESRLSKWDATAATLGQWDHSGANLNAGSDGLTIGWDDDTTFTGINFPAFTYQGRPKSVGAVALLAEFSDTVPGLWLVVQAYTSAAVMPVGAPDSIQWAGAEVEEGAQWVAASVGVPPRFLAVGLWGGAGVDVPANFQCSIYVLTCFERTEYIDVNRSVLTGFMVAQRVYDMVNELSPDTSLMEPTDFVTPALYNDDPQTPRALLALAAGYDDTLAKIDAQDRLIFRPRPATPSVEFGSDSPPTEETPVDPSTLAASVVLTMQDDWAPDSSNATVETRVTVLDLPETPRRPAPALFPNPSFEYGSTDGWGVEPEGESWLQIADDHPPDGYNFAYAAWQDIGGPTAPSGELYTFLEGELPAGVPVAINFWAFNYGDLTGWSEEFGTTFVASLPLFLYDNLNPTSFVEIQVPLQTGDTAPFPWWNYDFSFVPEETWAEPVVMFYSGLTATSAISSGAPPLAGLPTAPDVPVLGNFTLWTAAGPLAGVTAAGSLTVPDGSTPDILPTIGQAYLRDYNRLGYTQTRVVSDGQARDAATGMPLPASTLLRYTAETARLADRIDPTSGAVGAQGYISGVTYDGASKRATVSLGQRYGSVDEWVARLAAWQPAS